MVRTFIPQKLPLRHLQWEKLIPLIGEANRALGRFDATTKSLPASLLSHLAYQEAIDSIHSQDTSITVKDLIQNKKNKEDIVKIENYLKALKWGIFHSKKKDPFSTRFICEIHARIKKDAYKSEVGKIRRRQNWIGPEGCTIDEAYFYPPKAEKVPLYMKQLHAYLDMPEKDPVVQIAIYFAQFLAIHPFMDGNGRVARVLTPLLLYKKQLVTKPYLFLSSYFSRNRNLYIQNLYLLKTNNAWERWIAFFLSGIIEQCDRSCKMASTISAGPRD